MDPPELDVSSNNSFSVYLFEFHYGLQFHVKNCPQRAAFERWYRMTEEYKAAESESSFELTECEDSWDDCNAPAYDPWTASANANVIRSIQGKFDET